MSVAGKHIFITGATAGIGLAAAKSLAQAGARITLTARNPEKGQQALAEIRAESERDDHAVVAMDFANLQSVRDGVQRFLSINDRLDILLNNAGVVNTRRQLTADGFEETFAVNHLAPFLLAGLLIPVLLNPGSRIVNVASDAHTFVRGMDFDDLHAEARYRTFGVYGRSKLANMLFTIELAERLSAHSVTCNSLHPGAVSTSLGTQNGGLMGKVLPLLLSPFFKTPAQGAATSIYLCADESIGAVSGKYFANSRPAQAKPWAEDRSAARQLWTVSEELTGMHYPI